MRIARNCVLECAIMKIQENKEGLKLNGTHQFLVSADGIKLLEEKCTIKKNTWCIIFLQGSYY
jgi:hypothetical protein